MYVMGTHVLQSPGEMLSRVIFDRGVILHNTISKGSVLNEKTGIMGLDSEVESLSEEGRYYLGDLSMLVVEGKPRASKGKIPKVKSVRDKKTLYVSEDSRGSGKGYYLHDSRVNSYVVDIIYTVDETGVRLDLLEGFKKITEVGLRDIDDSEVLSDLIPILDNYYEDILEDISIIYEKLVTGVIKTREKGERN